MAILYKTLLVLLALRLLMPPGICVCQQSSVASRLLAETLGAEGEDQAKEEHDHVPGCPASDLAAGMGLRPDGPPAPSLDCQQPDLSIPIPHLSLPAPAINAAPLLGPAHSGLWPPNAALYQTLCALLI